MDDFLHKLDWVVPMRNNALTPVFECFTWLGYPVFFFLSLPILFWVWDKNAAHQLAIAILFSALLNYFLKDFFQDPRPTAYFMAGHTPESFGLPSGHTQVGIVFWFSIALEIGKRWAWIGAFIFASGIAFSRLYLGVHDVEDVLAGAVLGLAGLAVIRGLFKTHRWIQNTVLGLIGLGMIAFWPHGPLPNTVLMIAGFLPGWIIGFWWKGSGFPGNNTALWHKVLIAAIGLLVLVASRLMLEKIFIGLQFSESSARVIGGGLIGLLVTAGIPALVTRIELTKKTMHSN